MSKMIVEQVGRTSAQIRDLWPGTVFQPMVEPGLRMIIDEGDSTSLGCCIDLGRSISFALNLETCLVEPWPDDETVYLVHSATLKVET